MGKGRKRNWRTIPLIPLLAAACVGPAGQSPSSTASPAVLPPSSVSPADETTTRIPLPSPRFTVSPTWPGHSLPSGVTVVDGASTIDRLDWSPNGKLLAVLTWGGVWGTGRADVLDLAGRRLASFDAFDLAWVDDSHMMTLAVSPGDIGHGTVAIHSLDGSGSTVVAGSYAGILGNGHGSVALLAPLVGGGAPPDDSFHVWSNGQLGPRIAGYGQPRRWSADGRLLAFTAEGKLTDGPRGMGGSIPGTLTVLRLPEQTVVASVPLDDIRFDVYFSPDGGRLATSAGLVVDLSNGHQIQVTGRPDGWTASNELVLVDSNYRVSLWTPAKTVTIPNAFNWAIFGPTDDEIATLPAADDSDNPALPMTAVVRRGGASVSIQLGWSKVATWSSTGVCFIATGTYDAQVEDNHLLRVELPQS